MTIAQRVEAGIKTLRGATRAELLAWAKANAIENKAAWGRFKAALRTHGIDYDDLRTTENHAHTEERDAAVSHVVELYSDAKASHSRFGITDAEGRAVWFGRFFEDDRDFDGEQSSGEIAAAKKAVWLSSKIRDALRENGSPGAVVGLLLHVDAQWLCWAKGGKARELGSAARRLGVALRIVHVPGTENPAHALTVTAGFMKWSERPLLELMRPVAETNWNTAGVEK